MQLPSPIIKLSHPLLVKQQIDLFVKRDDLIDPVLSGNKWRKLVGYLPYIQQHNIRHVISFGGAFSNHLHALSALCQQYNIQLTAFVRGEASNQNNPTLQDCLNWGAKLHFLTRTEYRCRTNPTYLQKLQQLHPNSLIIEEGGFGQFGLVGLKALMDEIKAEVDFDVLTCPVGSGTTAAGLLMHLSVDQQLMAVSAIKKGQYLQQQIVNLLPKDTVTQASQLDLLCEYHFGGFGKVPTELLEFCLQVKQEYHLCLDPIYTSKSFFALLDKIKQGQLKAGTKVVFLHTGGLQGWRGMLDRKCISSAQYQTLTTPH